MFFWPANPRLWPWISGGPAFTIHTLFCRCHVPQNTPPCLFFPTASFSCTLPSPTIVGLRGGGALQIEREREREINRGCFPCFNPNLPPCKSPPPPRPQKKKKIHEHVSRRNPALICSFQARRRTASGRDYPRWRRQRWCFLLPPGSCVGGNNNNH